VKLSERALRAQDKGKASEGANETAAVTATTTSTPAEGWRELAKRKRALGYDAVANVAYLPLTVHWYVELFMWALRGADWLAAGRWKAGHYRVAM